LGGAKTHPHIKGEVGNTSEKKEGSFKLEKK
jgi:hypothetical protein